MNEDIVNVAKLLDAEMLEEALAANRREGEFTRADFMTSMGLSQKRSRTVLDAWIREGKISSRKASPVLTYYKRCGG